jgi:hypothetical protein
LLELWFDPIFHFITLCNMKHFCNWFTAEVGSRIRGQRRDVLRLQPSAQVRGARAGLRARGACLLSAPALLRTQTILQLSSKVNQTKYEDIKSNNLNQKWLKKSNCRSELKTEKIEGSIIPTKNLRPVVAN